MNTSSDSVTYSRTSTTSLALATLQHQAPAIFATRPDPRTSAAYTFISTERVLAGLLDAGFAPVDVRQTRTRRASPLHARHLIRLRRDGETVALNDCIPEILFLNSHDGTTSYQLRMGLFRLVCTNGLVVSVGAFPAFRVPHRGDVVADVVQGALDLAERFSALTQHIEDMQRRTLGDSERLRLAERALELRFERPVEHGMRAGELLTPRRAEDTGDDLWHVFNVIQENLLRGGLTKWSNRGRMTRTRAITAIREDVRLNTRLWDLASEYLAA